MGVGFRRFAVDLFATRFLRRRTGAAFTATRRLRGGLVRVRALCFGRDRLALSAALCRAEPKNLICFADILRRVLATFFRTFPRRRAGF